MFQCFYDCIVLCSFKGERLEPRSPRQSLSFWAAWAVAGEIFWALELEAWKLVAENLAVSPLPNGAPTQPWGTESGGAAGHPAWLLFQPTG